MTCKVLHLPTSVGGHAWGVAKGERDLGFDSQVLVAANNWLQYPCDIDLGLIESDYRIAKAWKLLKGFIKYRKGYDVYHFNFGSSLLDFPQYGLNLLDLPFYSDTAKIFVTYNGCDARQKYKSIERYEFSACHRDDCYNGVCNEEKKDINKAFRIKKFSRYAEHVFSVNPDILEYLPHKSTFIPYAIANWEQCKFIGIKSKNVLKIVHAPTNRICKGSDYVLQALKKIQSVYGEKVQIRLIENMANSDAMKLYMEADLIIDQLLIGWYGAFAVEAMKMGKPVMCFIRDEDLKYIPPAMAKDCRETIISVTPKTILAKLQEIIENRNCLLSYSKKSSEYVQVWHSPQYVAALVSEYY